MHGLRRELMEVQLSAIGIPYSTVELPENPSMEEYNNAMETTVIKLKNKGFTTAAFGDIFLEDLRKYREEKLATVSIKALFPLWKKDTHLLSKSFIEAGFKAIVVCCSAQLLNESFIGRIYDADFIESLPADVDPCGENGEFHTFCFDGPLFSHPVKFTKGEVIKRTYKNPSTCKNNDTTTPSEIGFWYCDLLPV